MANINLYEQTTEVDGLQEKILWHDKLPSRRRKATIYSLNNWSFRVGENGYAYENDDKENKMTFYHVVDVPDKAVLDYLENCDRNEERENRRRADNESVAYIQYLLKQDNEKGDDDKEDVENPMDQYTYEEPCSYGRPFPIDARKLIINLLIPELSEGERETYELLFNSNYPEIKIKCMLGLSDSAWTNRKNRLIDKAIRVLKDNGYDVPPRKKAVSVSTESGQEEVSCYREEQEEIWYWRKEIAKEVREMDRQNRLFQREQGRRRR